MMTHGKTGAPPVDIHDMFSPVVSQVEAGALYKEDIVWHWMKKSLFNSNEKIYIV